MCGLGAAKQKKRIQSAKYFKRVADGDGCSWIMCDALNDGAIEMTFLDIPQNEQSELIDDLSMVDLMETLASTQIAIDKENGNKNLVKMILFRLQPWP